LLFYCSSGSSRKGSGRRTGSVHGSCCFTWVPEGSRKVRKAYPEAHRKENNHLISQKSKCQQSDFSQSGEDHSRCFCFDKNVSRIPGSVPEGNRKLPGSVQTISAPPGILEVLSGVDLGSGGGVGRPLKTWFHSAGPSKDRAKSCACAPLPAHCGRPAWDPLWARGQIQQIQRVVDLGT